MKKKQRMFGWLCLAGIVLMAGACASVPIETIYSFEQDAVKLRFIASSDLHFFDGEPHTLHVCVYQLRAVNTFDQLAEHTDGLYELLNCSLFDSNVTRSNTFSIQPSTNLVYPVHRYDHSRYIGIVAGYKAFQKDRMVRLIELPMEVKKIRTGWFKHRKIMQPKSADIEINLGAEQIERVFVSK